MNEMKRNVVVIGLVVLLAVVMGTTGCRTKPTSPIKPPFDETTTPTVTSRPGDDADDAGPGGLTGRELTPLDGPEQPDAREWLFTDDDRGLQKVYFEFDKSNLTAESRASLEHNAAVLKEHSDIRVLIEGHCDERGTIEYNLALGERRALAARNYLINLGIDPDRLATISYGEERPADLGHDEEAWGKNRRDDFRAAD
jgi:peptidoglycan-associated lipoprotein